MLTTIAKFKFVIFLPNLGKVLVACRYLFYSRLAVWREQFMNENIHNNIIVFAYKRISNNDRSFQKQLDLAKEYDSIILSITI